jgi:GTP-binding protein
MFIDKVTVELHAGDGGNGIVSFRKEKFVDKGGPNGGDGGDGGDIILRASRNQNTLASFRFQKLLQAESGSAGSKQNKHGKSGQDMVVDVPVGTVVFDEEGKELTDLSADDQTVVIAKGGKGGFGNAHFVSSRRQAPRVAEKGEPGDHLKVQFELKMIADVGLVGLPNAGKSTFLAAVSNAKPEIADYPFTTLVPNLGVVDVSKGESLLIADIPGLIEGASEGKGLGDEFLRHVERTSVLLHLIDSYQDDIVEAYKTIQGELASYVIDLSAKPQIIALTKIEGLDEEMTKDNIARLKKVVSKGTQILAVSAKSKQNIDSLLYALSATVKQQKVDQAVEESENTKLPVITLSEDPHWIIEHDEETKKWLVMGQKIERFARRTDFGDVHGEQRFRDIMRKLGIMRELQRKGINPGDKIVIGKEKYGELKY